MNKKEVNKYFPDDAPQLVTVNHDTWDIHFAEIGSDTLPLVVFVHGAPGSWSAFRHFLKDKELRSKSHIISVDRPGYGHSNFGRAQTSIEKQAALIKPLLKRNKSGKGAILVGHSLGGPVIARMAMDYPELVSSLIYLAPSVAPELEPEEWYRTPLYLPIIRWVLPTSFDMTNREIYHLKSELEEMLPLWKNISAYSTVIQGGEDKLVHPGNAQFIQEMTTNGEVNVMLLEGVNHFIPWNQADTIKAEVLKHIQSARSLKMARTVVN